MPPRGGDLLLSVGPERRGDEGIVGLCGAHLQREKDVWG